MAVLYSDERLTLDTDGVTIKLYYFPFGDKRILYSELTRVEEHDMGESITGGRWRIWGSGDLTHWFNFDPDRPNKRIAFVLHKGGHVRAVITPDEPDPVRALFQERGFTVEPAEE